MLEQWTPAQKEKRKRALLATIQVWREQFVEPLLKSFAAVADGIRLWVA